MNKRYALTGILLLFIITVHAQQVKHSLLYDFVTEKRTVIKQMDQLEPFGKLAGTDSSKINAILSERSILSLKKNVTFFMYHSRLKNISLTIPSSKGNYQLELIQEDINGDKDFFIGILKRNAVATRSGRRQGLHYRGYVNGDPSSIAAFSIFSNGEVMGLFCTSEGNFNIGKIAGSNKYVLYNSKAMITPLGFECGTSELPPQGLSNPVQQSLSPTQTLAPTLLCKKVRVYWEADYKLYSNNFGSNFGNTANYLTGLFNQVAVMYQNEGILIELTDTYIWTTADPYTTSTSSNGLATFKSRWNALGDNFKADLAVLIDGGPTNNGGVAYLLTNNLCYRFYAYGYANVYASYNTVPAYSWDVEVVTHEMGHMMGSNHTHWCGWNTGAGGTCGAIDDCYTTEAFGSCSSCAATTSTNPSPPAGFHGTVMSYCHLRSGIGIDLANGFGPLPQAAIRNTVNIAACAVYDNKWTGTVSTAWENPANWNCGIIPNATTDVTIPSGLTNYPVITSAAVCRRIKQEPNTNVLVKMNFTLNIVGQ